MSNWLTNIEAFECKAQLAFFKLSHPTDHFSMFLAVVSLFVALLPAVTMTVYNLLGLGLLFYVIQKYYAMRVYYDVALLEAWSNADNIDLASLDKVLHDQFGATLNQKNLPNRLLGIRRLFNKQIILIGLQLISLVIGLIFYFT